MKLLKRWTTSVCTSFDWVISQVENHEALVNTAIREMQQALAKAKVQLGRVKKDGSQLRERLAELQIAKDRWEERALRLRETEKERAIECLRRKKRTEAELKHLEGALKEHERLEGQLNRDLNTIQSRIEVLKRKKNAFTARQFRAEAGKASSVEDIGLISEIDDIFDRWDCKISQCELVSEASDAFEEEFEQQEEDDELEAELEELANLDARQ